MQVYGIFIVELASTFLVTNASWIFIVVRAGNDVTYGASLLTSPAAVGMNIMGDKFILFSFFTPKLILPYQLPVLYKYFLHGGFQHNICNTMVYGF